MGDEVRGGNRDQISRLQEPLILSLWPHKGSMRTAGLPAVLYIQPRVLSSLLSEVGRIWGRTEGLGPAASQAPESNPLQAVTAAGSQARPVFQEF